MELIDKQIDLMNKEEELRGKELAAAEKAGILSQRDRKLKSLEAETQWHSDDIKDREDKLM